MSWLFPELGPAQEGIFSDFAKKAQEKKAAWKADRDKQFELSDYAKEKEKELEKFSYRYDAEPVLKQYVDYCSDKLVKSSGPAMKKMLAVIEKIYPGPSGKEYIYTVGGYSFLIAPPEDDDDPITVITPTQGNIDAANRGDWNDIHWYDVWGVIDEEIGKVYAEKKYAEVHPESAPATESWLFADAQEGFFSDMAAKAQARRDQRAANHQKMAELEKYYGEMQEIVDDLPYGSDKKFIELYVQYCSDELIDKAASGSLMSKIMSNFDKTDMCGVNPKLLKIGGYSFILADAGEYEDSRCLICPTQECVDKVKRGAFDQIYAERIDNSNSESMYDRICEAYSWKKYADVHPESATESWLFAEPAQEAIFDILKSSGRSNGASRNDVQRFIRDTPAPQIIDEFMSIMLDKGDFFKQYNWDGAADLEARKKGIAAKTCTFHVEYHGKFPYAADKDIHGQPIVYLPINAPIVPPFDLAGWRYETFSLNDMAKTILEYRKSHPEAATESDVLCNMSELEKAQAFVSAWVECHSEDMEPLSDTEADEQLKQFRAVHVADELREDPNYVDPHEEQHYGRLTYLVEVKPDGTNVTIPVCINGRNTVIEYGNKEIEESLARYYDTAMVGSQDEIISDAAQESIFGKVLGWVNKSGTKKDIISEPAKTAQHLPPISRNTFAQCLANYSTALLGIRNSKITLFPTYDASPIADRTKVMELLKTITVPDGDMLTIETFRTTIIGVHSNSRNEVVDIYFPVMKDNQEKLIEIPSHWFAETYENVVAYPADRVAAYQFAVKLAERVYLPIKKAGMPLNTDAAPQDELDEFVQMDASEISILGYDLEDYVYKLKDSEEIAMWNMLDQCDKEFAKQFNAKFGKQFCVYGDGDKNMGYLGIATRDKYDELKKVEAVIESWGPAEKRMNAYINAAPKWAKEKKSARVKDINARTKANMQACPDRKKLFKITAQAIRSQKGWKTGDAGKQQCEEMVVRQQKNVDRVISAEVDNFGDLYYMVVHTKESGNNEWIMYIPQVAGVKTRNLHQAAREIALLQNAGKAKGLPSLESTITFG